MKLGTRRSLTGSKRKADAALAHSHTHARAKPKASAKPVKSAAITMKQGPVEDTSNGADHDFDDRDDDANIDWAAEMEDVEGQDEDDHDNTTTTVNNTVHHTDDVTPLNNTKKQSSSALSLHARYDNHLALTLTFGNSSENMVLPLIDKHRVNVTKYTRVPLSLDTPLKVSLSQFCLALLTRALTDRVTAIDVSASVSSSKKGTVVKLNVYYVTSTSTTINARTIDYGPSAELPLSNPTMSDWRHLYGSKSELRRFKDGRILECVVWKGGDVVREIAEYVLHRHVVYDSDNVSLVVDRDLSRIYDALLMTRSVVALTPSLTLSSPTVPALTNEAKILSSFTELSTVLRGLNELPLSIVSVRAMHPLFRHTACFAPTPLTTRQSVNDSVISSVEVIECECLLESSSQWPDDIHALNRIKSAFYIAIHQSLANAHTIDSVVSLQYIDVIHHQFVYRVRIIYEKEFYLYSRGSRGYRQFDYRFNVRPKLHSAIKYYVASGRMFLTRFIALFKRWLSSQGLSLYFNEVCIELLVLALYQRYSESVSDGGSDNSGVSSELMLLVNVWNELRRFDFATQPLTVKFHEPTVSSGDGASVNEDSLVEAAWSYQSTGRTSGQALYLATIYDVPGVYGTSAALTPAILSQLKVLAGTCYQHVTGLLTSASTVPSNHFLTPFKSASKEFCQVIVTVKVEALPVYHWQRSLTNSATSASAGTDAVAVRYKAPIDTHSKSQSLPLLGVHAMRSLVHCLQQRFGSVCQLYADYYGGSVIGVRVIDSVTDTAADNGTGGSWSVKGSSVRLPNGRVNVSELMAEIRWLGAGIINTIALNPAVPS